MSSASAKTIVSNVEKQYLRKDLPSFRVGDTLRVHVKIKEGTKERIQIFEGVVIKRHNGNHPTSTFTVRKVSYNVGVERTFLLHSPRIDKIEVTTRGIVRRSRLFYLRPLRGKATRIKTHFQGGVINSERPVEAEQDSQAQEVVADTPPETSTESTPS